MSRHKSLMIVDDEDEAEAELNPFSFREFVRNHGPDPGSEHPKVQGPSSSQSSRKQTFAPMVESAFLWEPLHSVLGEQTANSFSRTSPMQQLQEENMCLRRSLKDLHKSSSVYQERIQQLSEELVCRRREEEKETQALESMVQSVEQNLHLMTKRAVKAENSVSKLKQELQLLQVIKSENERLLAEQLDTMTAMKHNAQAAAEYLGKTTTQARSSIKLV
ncbi:hypothetical protein NHX12_029183 [Muraenolepis orangiensis]|uniref:Endosome-associated-trafficking regulator 1 n=1 Tax=Muraenolepis orangiensis TaxID=630683 RepID=A0A9Q0EF62_9TELE|nr:hypothetical protein NHX12_029183 [Muraenolepis orangiensis]